MSPIDGSKASTSTDAASTDAELLERIRQQFDEVPYPHVPLNRPPDERRDLRYAHDLTSAFYIRDRRVPELAGMTVLDFGCGSGVKTLMLAAFNPGVRILGVDLSPASIELARERAKYHGLDDRVEFRVAAVEDLAALGETFDYINCDEVLYLLPDPLAGLQAVGAVLKPRGLVRANFHDRYQRFRVYRAQQAFDLLGLRSRKADRAVREAVEATISGLRAGSSLRNLWQPYAKEDEDTRHETIAANFLLQGDRGFTVPEVFDLLASAGLAFVSPLEPSQWDVRAVFKQPDDLPEVLAQKLNTATVAERMHLRDLINAKQRTIDFWCTPAPWDGSPTAPDDWTEGDWDAARISLHPALQTAAFRDAVAASSRYLKPLNMAEHFPRSRGIGAANAAIAPCLLPLFDGPQPLAALVDRLLQVRPVDPGTLAPTRRADATRAVCDLLREFEKFSYIFLERPS